MEHFNMDDSIHIYTTTWLQEDHISEINSILGGVSVDDVENKLISYVVENIEPGGWNAMWQPMQKEIAAIALEEDSMPDCFIVEVNHVCLNVLEAHIVISDGLNNGFISTSSKNQYVGKNMKVPLVQLFPLTQQENPHVDIAGTAEVVEHVRFFYDHIWLPWDIEDEFCTYEERIISNRIQFYQDTASNCIPVDVVKELKGIVSEAKTIRQQIDELSLNELDDDTDVAMQEQELVRMIQLHKLLAELKSRHEYLRDPALRGIAAYHKRMERRSLMESFTSEESFLPKASHVLLVCSSCSTDDFISRIAELPHLLKDLPGVSENAKIKTFPFLQLALDSSNAGDTIVVLPGRYSLENLGELAKGGTICGLEGLVEIVGSSSCGNVMLDLHLESIFTLRSVYLLPLENQCAVVVHSGDLVMENCSIIIDCCAGVTLLADTACNMVNCQIQSAKSHSLICRSGSKITIAGFFSRDILKGPVLIEEGVQIVEGTQTEETGTSSELH